MKVGNDFFFHFVSSSSIHSNSLEVFTSVLNPEFIQTIDKIFKMCAIERIWKFYCINQLLEEFNRIEKLLIKGEIIYEMILNNCISNVIMDEEKLINNASQHCTFNDEEISSLRQTNRLCFDRFLHKLLNNGRVSNGMIV